MNNKIVRDVVFLTAANALMALAQWMLLAFISYKWGVSHAGEYSFALSVLAPAFLFVYQSYRTLIITDHGLDVGLLDYFRLRVILTFFILLLFVVFGFAFFGAIDRQRLGYLGVVFLLKAVEGLFDLAYAALHRDKKGYVQAISIVLRCFIGFIGFAAGVLIFQNFIAAFFCLGLSWYIVFHFYDNRRLVPAFSWDKMVPKGGDIELIIKIFSRASPLIFSSFVGAIIFSAPRYSVDYVLGVEELGYFSLLTSFSIAINLLCASLGQAILPWLVSAYAEGAIRKFLMVLAFAILISVCASVFSVVVALLFGERVLDVFFSIQDEERTRQFVLLMLLFLPIYVGQVLSFANTAVRRFKSTFIITIVSLAAVIFLSIPLIDRYRIIGAGMVFAVLGLTQIFGFGVSVFWGLRQSVKNHIVVG